VKRWLFILFPWLQLQAQPNQNCILKDPTINITFGSGTVSEDYNDGALNNYRRVSTTCPTDGHYSYTPYTSDCFRGDWITLDQDHTGNHLGNMLLVNAAYEGGEFFSAIIQGLDPGKKYEFAVWMLNVCKPSDKCPFPLLPNITVELETLSGKAISQLSTGDLPRYGTAQWTKFTVMFDLPSGANSLVLKMTNSAPGGCGNDFAVDDITFRECVPPPPVTTTKKTTVTKSPPVVKAPPQKPAVEKTTSQKPPASTTSTVKKTTPPVSHKTTAPVAAKKTPAPASVSAQATKVDSVPQSHSIANPTASSMKPPPPVISSRKNSLVKKIEAEAGEIRIDLYDNGEIDGDTVSVYHNNSLLISHAGLSQKAITFHITINHDSPHHELVMVAENLGSIPPNTSLMIVTAGTNRYELFISSSEQNNAKVVFDLKE